MISLLNKLPKQPSPLYSFASTHAAQQEQQSKFNYYCSLRIYQKRTMFELLNNIMINQCLKINYLVDNGPSIVGLTYKVLGQTIANILIKNTIGTVFTAGENIQDLEKYISTNQKFPLILNYCSEAIEGMQNKEKFYDHNSEVFRNIVELCSKYNSKQHMVSFKISCMVSLELLKKINDGKTLIVNLFDKISQGQQTINVSQIFEYFEQQGIKLKDQDKNTFITDILGMKNEQDQIDRVTFTYKIQPIFMFKNELNNNPIIQYCNQLNENDHNEFKIFVERMKYILDPAVKNGVICMVDSEQSYLQQTIDTLTEQMQEYYNQNQVIVMNTLQNYLKSSGSRIDYEMQKAERFGTPVVFKMVRGAYLVEENRLAKQLNIESPINDGFDATTEMIERNLNKIIKNANKFNTKIFVASHNEQTIEFTKKEVQQYQIKDHNIMFAQLYGLSDHMSYSLADQGYNIYKYIPFGKTEIMIPYLLRRAQETKMVLQQSSLQTQLLIDELKRRLYLK